LKFTNDFSEFTNDFSGELTQKTSYKYTQLYEMTTELTYANCTRFSDGGTMLMGVILYLYIYVSIHIEKNVYIYIFIYMCTYINIYRFSDGGTMLMGVIIGDAVLMNVVELYRCVCVCVCLNIYI